MIRRHSHQLRIGIATCLGGGFLLWVWMQNPYVGMWLAGVGVVSLLSYRADKLAAVAHQWRIPESRLHAQDLLGGWIGGWLGRLIWRHKTNKPTFIALFWLTVAFNVGAVLWLLIAS